MGAFEETSSRNKGVGLAVSLGLTETCNVLSARSAVASPCAEMAHAAKRTAITFIAETAAESTLLPGQPHADPADRFLIAAARTQGLILATRDESIIDYGNAGHVRVLEL